MNAEPFSFKHALGDFDVTKLPVDPAVLQADSGMLAMSVQAYYEELLRKLGGTAAVAIRDGEVSVVWYPSSGDAVEMVLQHAMKLLRQGEYSSAEPLLRMLLGRNPDDPNLLYNLGMMLSDQGNLSEALPMLERLVAVDPEDSNAWTALGVAYSRNHDCDKAESALQRALSINPDNAYALRNLGSLRQHMAPEVAMAGLKKAAQMLPDDPGTQYAYARCLLDLGQEEEADAIMQRIIQIAPLSETAELARSARRQIAHESLRANATGGLRMDAVFFCLDGIKKFREIGNEQMRAVVYEIAVLGRSGLDINNDTQKYTLKSLPGSFSGLHLVSLLYTGSKLINPMFDCGIDLSQEYARALKLANG